MDDNSSPKAYFLTRISDHVAEPYKIKKQITILTFPIWNFHSAHSQRTPYVVRKHYPVLYTFLTKRRKKINTWPHSGRVGVFKKPSRAPIPVRSVKSCSWLDNVCREKLNTKQTYFILRTISDQIFLSTSVPRMICIWFINYLLTVYCVQSGAMCAIENNIEKNLKLK